MTLQQISSEYKLAAGLLRDRLRLLRMRLKVEMDPAERWRLQRRIAELKPMLTEMNELADLTAHYYDRGYYRNEKYTFQRTGHASTAGRSAIGADPAGDRPGID